MLYDNTRFARVITLGRLYNTLNISIICGSVAAISMSAYDRVQRIDAVLNRDRMCGGIAVQPRRPMDDNDDLRQPESSQQDVPEPAQDSAREIVEALVIATTEPLPLRAIAGIANISESAARTIIDGLNEEYRSSGRAFEIKEIAGGFQIYTLPRYAQWVGALHKRKERLSKPALETLAIVAYHQPIIRADIEKIRGVDATSVLDTLLQKTLIKTSGRLPGPGRPIKYVTTREFLRYFGIKDISELPKEEEFGERVAGGFAEEDQGPAGPPETEAIPLTDEGQAQEEDAGVGSGTDLDREEIIDLGVDDIEEEEDLSDSTPAVEPQTGIDETREESGQTDKIEEEDEDIEHL